ncbi:MAG: hypothetical protein WDW38_005494 [Sanguina aurantia]
MLQPHNVLSLFSPPQRRLQPSTPEHVTMECLTLFRKPDLEGLQEFLPVPVNLSSLAPPVLVGGAWIYETGPLAGCAYFLDTAARRVLPGHVLRRCRVLSSLHIGSMCQQRVAITACTGEETVLLWRLQGRILERAGRNDSSAGDGSDPVGGGSGSSNASDTSTGRSSGSQESSSASSTFRHQQQQQQQQQPDSVGDSRLPTSAGAPGGVTDSRSWMLESIRRDDSSDETDLPTKTHPRASPEAVMLAQLQALRSGDVTQASSYNLWSRGGKSGSVRSAPGPRLFVWELILSGTGCWVVESIKAMVQ